MSRAVRTSRPVFVLPAKRYYAHLASGQKCWANATCFMNNSKLATRFHGTEPTRFKHMFKHLPAYEKWFTLAPVDPEENTVRFKKMSFKPKKKQIFEESIRARNINPEYMDQFGDTVVPMELTRTDDKNKVLEFERFQGPLSLLLATIKKKPTLHQRLYLAQHSLADLPQTLQDDLPTPELIKSLGKGDVYASSLWMGTGRIRTPLHRDPNPNLFVQLSGKKTFRLMSPEVGKRIYETAKARIGTSHGQANMRGEEMMQGEELEALERAVWGGKKGDKGETLGFEVELKKGDGLYIPLGWWHAVRGKGNGANVSVNWWFR